MDGHFFFPVRGSRLRADTPEVTRDDANKDTGGQCVIVGAMHGPPLTAAVNYSPDRLTYDATESIFNVNSCMCVTSKISKVRLGIFAFLLPIWRFEMLRVEIKCKSWVFRAG